MKNKLLIIFTAFSLLASCALTLGASNSKETAQVAWENLGTYKQASDQILTSMIELGTMAKFTEEGFKSYLAAKERMKQVVEKSTKALQESESALKKNNKYDESWQLRNISPPELLSIHENIEKNIHSVLNDIESQKEIIVNYANAN